jgi:hypothetical protein
MYELLESGAFGKPKIKIIGTIDIDNISNV